MAPMTAALMEDVLPAGRIAPDTSDDDQSTMSPTSSICSPDFYDSAAAQDVILSVVTSHSTTCHQPLHAFFEHGDVQMWEQGRFRMERSLGRGPRGHGRVDHMFDSRTGTHVAVKTMESAWACESHELFVAKYLGKAGEPWVHIGCAALLTDIGFPYSPPLLGVYRDCGALRVVAEHAPEGDVLEWCRSCSLAPGPDREELVWPLASQLVDAVRRLHKLSIVHRDLCAENVVLARQGSGGALMVQIADFGLATRKRFVRGGCSSNRVYQAPEAHSGEFYDGFRADGFAVGVLVWGLLIGEHPWVSTAPGGCKAFEFCRTHGFRAHAARRKCFRLAKTVAQCMSEPAVKMLEGLLAADPSLRLTLDECVPFFNGGEQAVVYAGDFSTPPATLQAPAMEEP